MLCKLSLNGIKSHLRDYLVLFSGLTIASAIFYMFSSLALNQNFLAKNSMISAANTQFVFAFGLVLLAIITFVYLNYANNFLLNLRKHDYGMFMMLGAKSSRIGTLIFIETMIIGFVATGVGILLGIGLTQLVTNMLVSNLDLKLTGFVGLYLPALLFTLVFFIILFLLAALINRRKLTKTPVLELLHDTEKPVNYSRKKGLIWLQAISGVILLAIGYLAMINVKILILASIPIALVTITLGSYFVFNSLMTVIIDSLRKRDSFLYKNFRIFTINQLKFRIIDYTKILSIISILFALALGAITVGMGFKQTMDNFDEMYYYDAKIVKSTPQVETDLKKIAISDQVTYSSKKIGDTIYLNESQFSNQPYKFAETNYDNKTGKSTTTIKNLTLADLQKDPDNLGYRLSAIFGQDGYDAKFKFVTQGEFDQLNGPVTTTKLIRAKNFKKDRQTLYDIEMQQVKADPKLQATLEDTKPITYQLANQMLSGFEFMGFFLGIAFLTMLASTLMFKVLSGAQSDKKRYIMLDKIGVRPQVLKSSIRKEIGILFALPALLGVIHVLFGLQFFKALMANPYYNIWIPFLIFFILYGFYYFLTVWIYQKTVIVRQK